jgi:hypothetical protein
VRGTVDGDGLCTHKLAQAGKGFMALMPLAHGTESRHKPDSAQARAHPLNFISPAGMSAR